MEITSVAILLQVKRLRARGGISIRNIIQGSMTNKEKNECANFVTAKMRREHRANTTAEIDLCFILKMSVIFGLRILPMAMRLSFPCLKTT